jgi:hypothetical protein
VSYSIPYSRPVLMKSASDAFKEGKTIDDCPHKFLPWAKTWQYEFQQVQKAQSQEVIS